MYQYAIELTQNQAYRMLKPIVGKKIAKTVFSKRPKNRRIQNELSFILHNTEKLKEIRLLEVFYCKLSTKQKYILDNNRQTYRLIINHKQQKKQFSCQKTK